MKFDESKVKRDGKGRFARKFLVYARNADEERRKRIKDAYKKGADIREEEIRKRAEEMNKPKTEKPKPEPPPKAVAKPKPEPVKPEPEPQPKKAKLSFEDIEKEIYEMQSSVINQYNDRNFRALYGNITREEAIRKDTDLSLNFRASREMLSVKGLSNISIVQLRNSIENSKETKKLYKQFLETGTTDEIEALKRKDKKYSNDSIMKRGEPYLKKLNKALEEDSKEKNTRYGFTKFIDSIAKMSDKQAFEYLKGIPNTSKKSIDPYIDAIRLTGDVGLQKIVNNGGGATANISGVISTGDHHNVRSASHEIGHLLEYNEPRLLPAVLEEQELRRVGGDIPYNEYNPYSTNPNPIVIGNFVHPYAGMRYSHNDYIFATEFISTGLEYLLGSKESLDEIMSKDKEHLQFILGILNDDPGDE
ncbi:MAG: hypothetical protein ACRC78_02725 [Planktothrix sp.]